jgi:hypothetical protein
VEKIRFRWSFIMLPPAILVVAIVSAAIFYGRLPQETGYHFSNGVAISAISRGALLAWTLGLQLVFVLAAAVIVFLVISVSRRLGLAESELNKTLVVIMGNMLALPQIIIFYAMLDIFLYNIYAKALPALWAFGLLMLFAGAIIIAVVFFRAFARSRYIKTKNTSGSETNGREQTR